MLIIIFSTSDNFTEMSDFFFFLEVIKKQNIFDLIPHIHFKSLVLGAIKQSLKERIYQNHYRFIYFSLFCQLLNYVKSINNYCSKINL